MFDILVKGDFVGVGTKRSLVQKGFLTYMQKSGGSHPFLLSDTLR